MGERIGVNWFTGMLWGEDGIGASSILSDDDGGLSGSIPEGMSAGDSAVKEKNKTQHHKAV